MNGGWRRCTELQMGYDTYGRPHKRLLIINKWRERERERERGEKGQKRGEGMSTHTHTCSWIMPFCFCRFHNNYNNKKWWCTSKHPSSCTRASILFSCAFPSPLHYFLLIIHLSLFLSINIYAYHNITHTHTLYIYIYM